MTPEIRMSNIDRDDALFWAFESLDQEPRPQVILINLGRERSEGGAVV